MSDPWRNLAEMIYEYIWADPEHVGERLDEILDIIKEEDPSIYHKILEKLEKALDEDDNSGV